jgi:hypothetical protein
MGIGVSGVGSVASQVDGTLDSRVGDPLTGWEHLQAVVRDVLRDPRLHRRLVVVVVELPGPPHPVEHARRLAQAGQMARTAFGVALAVARLGVLRVGILVVLDLDLRTRAGLLARMVHDLPATVRLEPLPGDPAAVTWLLRDLCR